MTEKEILNIYDKAEKYTENRMKDMPERFKANFIRNALYCAYLEGAGIRTK